MATVHHGSIQHWSIPPVVKLLAVGVVQAGFYARRHSA